MSGQWARPFRVTYPDGEILHGVQFPDGIVVTCGSFGLNGAVSFTDLREHLRMPTEAVVEWADGGQP